ncbi:MAG: FKBP-type peptidyl-prolyl cis-trans isomerase [Muribaculaceae bacterium]|nr:FKBP-type peptidyl-prolyl cis-trans isomerase [Muribaculaceae bacterium]
MMKFAKHIVIAACGLAASVMTAGAQTASVAQTADSVTAAAATVLGTALKGSIDNIEGLGVKLDRAQLKQMLADIIDGAQPAYSYERAYAIIDDAVVSQQRHYVDSVFSKEAQQAFIDKVAAEEGATVTPTGLVFQVIVEGEGVTPVSGDDVVVNYVGALSDGSEFDRSSSPVTFDVDRVVPGFSEGLKMMRPGGRYRLVIPASLGYGERGVPGDIPPNAALDFTVDMLQVVPKPTYQ